MSDVVDRLVDAGIDARAYARGPAGVRSFVASIDAHPRAGRLWIWEGRCQIEVATSKRHRQGVLNVAEETRELVQQLHTTAYHRGPTGRPIGWLSDEQIIDGAVAQMKSRWALPAGSSYEAVIKFKPKSLRSGSVAKVTVRAHAPASNTSLLMGMDETHHFVAQLPKFGVNTVRAAHALLTPPEARVPGTKRQGEWFFVPVRDHDVVETLMRRLNQVNYGPLEPGSSHHAPMTTRNGRMYAIGTVMDNRFGRHAPLLLHEFHQVIRNREVNVAPTPRAQPQLRRRSWD